MPFYTVSAHARQTQASPSISMEKGAYRMRAPAKRMQASNLRRSYNASRDGLPQIIREERQMAVLVMLLVCATFACFGSAYYLLTTRWDTPAARPRFASLRSDDIQAHDVDFGPDDKLHEHDAGERFLSYLPHSGFHNQRIAFENALVLSRLLNRTLLVPPIRLGSDALFYAPYDMLQEVLINSSQAESLSCSSVFYNAVECPNPTHTQISWDWLVDLSPIKQHQKLLPRWNFTTEWLRDTLGVDGSDTFILRDAARDMYGFQDFVSYSSTSARKYQHMIHLSTLANRPERLLQLGTLFGSSRLHLRDPHNFGVRKAIRADMAAMNSILEEAGLSVSKALGSTYVGAHVRLGDGYFLDNAEDNVRLVWWRLVHGVLGYSMEETLELELSASPRSDVAFTGPPEELPEVDELESLRIPSKDLKTTTTCPSSDPDSALNMPLYIATDSQDPRSDPRLAIFLRTFPCTLFLSDFDIDGRLGKLDTLRNARDKLMLKPFLMPFVDAIVAARAVRVVGTYGSTFSQFVEGVAWRVYHGMDIVSRG